MERVRRARSPKRRRAITISANHPMWAEVIVTQDDGEDTWTIESVRRCGVEPSARSLTESMDDDEFDEMYRKANAAEDMD